MSSELTIRSSFAFLPVLSIILLSFSGIADPSTGKVIDDNEITGADGLSSLKGPSVFTENLGQWPMDVDLIAEVDFGHIGLSDSGFVFDIAGHNNGEGNILRYDFVGCSRARPEGLDPLPYNNNYFFGKDKSRWVTGASNFREAVYEDVWNGIDIHFYLGDEGAKYEFHISPFARPEDILFKVSGHEAIVTDGKTLRIDLENGYTFRESGLKAFYIEKPFEAVDVSFEMDRDDQVSFEVGEYDHSRTLVIDPLLLNSTYVGGTGGEGGGITVKDESGCIYLIGDCSSGIFPTTPGAYSSTSSGYYDIVVFKMDKNLSKLIYSTYIGGVNNDRPMDIAYAGNGEVVIAGVTQSYDLPTTQGAYQKALNTSRPRGKDLFIIRLNGAGSSLIASTYVGWESDENNPCIALTDTGRPVIYATVKDSTLPIDTKSFDRTYNGEMDILVLEMSSDLSSIDHASFLGGSKNETVEDLEIGDDCDIFFTGSTNSKDFPVTNGSYETVFNGSCKEVGIVGRYNLSAGGFDFLSFYNFLTPNALELDSKGNIVLGGFTNSTALKTTMGCYQSTLGGKFDLAVVLMCPNGTNIIASTFFGGTENETWIDICLNETDHVFITSLGGPGYPVTPGAYSSNIPGAYGCSVSVLNNKLAKVIYSTFIGGSKWEYPYSIVPEAKDRVFISGFTASNDFPMTKGSFSTTFSGVSDMFICRMACPKIYLNPTQPRNLTGEIIDDIVTLRWESPIWDGDAGILGYNITRLAEHGVETMVGTTADLVFNDTLFDNSLTYSYNIHAFNRIGNSPPSKTITLWETIPPTINEDMTPSTQSPGEDLMFMVNVTDNSRIKKVDVFHWSDGTEVVQDAMVRAKGDLFVYNIRTDDRKYTIDYFFTAFDVKDNYITSSIRRVNITGEYLPVFEDDLTPRTAGPQDPIRFWVRVRDKWASPIVHLEFWTGFGHHRNVTMEQSGANDHIYDTKVTGLPGENITYIFRAVDIHGNWNSSSLTMVQIVNDDYSSLLSDLSERTATTGDKYTFNVIFDHNLVIDDLRVSYKFGDGPDVVLDMDLSKGTVWSKSIIVPDTVTPLEYRFIIKDRSGNMNQTQWSSVEVRDNDLPIIDNDSSDDMAYDGRSFTFLCSVTDNVGVGKVTAECILNGGQRAIVILQGEEAFKGTLDVPVDAVGVLEYLFRAFDTSGNEQISEKVKVNVLDFIGPTVKDIANIMTYVGWEVRIVAEVSDNLKVTNVVWTGLPELCNGTEWKGSFERPGTYQVTVRVVDAAENLGSTTFTVTVLSEMSDLDNDGLPDLFEMAHGLDPTNSSDASLDMDMDDLTNLEEYESCTKIDVRDTDDDGMDDGWEVGYGFDPLTFSAFSDPDEDGRPNLQEYLEGTDPLMADLPNEDGEKHLDIIKYSILAVLLSIFVVLLIFIFRKKK